MGPLHEEGYRSGAKFSEHAGGGKVIRFALPEEKEGGEGPAFRWGKKKTTPRNFRPKKKEESRLGKKARERLFIRKKGCPCWKTRAEAGTDEGSWVEKVNFI